MRRSHPWSLVLVWILLVVAGAQLAGCAATTSTTTTASTVGSVASTEDIAGTYTLETINAVPLPYTMTHEEPGVRVTSGTFTIHADGTCTSNTSFELPSGQASSREARATWTREGDTLRMSWEGAGTTIGTVTGGTFTMTNEGQVLAYRKRS